MIDTNLIYDTLLAKLVAGVPELVTATRNWLPWDDLKSVNQPALVLDEPTEDAAPNYGQPTKWTLSVSLLLYKQVDTNPGAPATMSVLDSLIKKIGLTLEPPIQNGAQTLGLDTVQRCWIKGKIQKDGGTLDGQGFAIVPIEIIAVG